jgi:prepilin peptidase CpaA
VLAAWLLWLILAIHFDLLHRRVPNWLVLCGAAAAGVSLLLDSQPFGISGTAAFTGAMAGFIFLLIFYATGFLGAGDVKFAGVLGLWVGWQTLVPIWVGASLLAGVHAVLWMLLQRWHRFPRLRAALSGMSTASPDGGTAPRRTRHIPFAAYLAVASVGWLISRGSGS